MEKSAAPLEINAWVVHRQFGIGRIIEIEEKSISGAETPYYRIEGVDHTIYWVPVEDVDCEQLRPLAELDELQEALDILYKPAKKMAKNHKTRKSRIKDVRLRNSPLAMARIIRDLRARRYKQKILNQTERQALENFTHRLAQEWALVTGKDPEEAGAAFERLLQDRLTREKNA